ncbi:MAG: phytanoyl-CoA dioxygenase family protein [Halobacteriaceae archaeon]
MALVDEDDWAFFEENGYVVVEEAVPAQNCEAVVEEIWEFLGHDPDDPETWYDPPEGMDEPFGNQDGGMVEMYHSQAQWDNYQHPRVYQAAAEVLGEEALWVHLDRVNMTPPVREDHPELSNWFVHWDTDTTDLPDPIPTPHGIQGVLYLEDTSEDQGGFQCVPELYRELDAEWFEEHPDAAESGSPDVSGYDVEAVPGEQGDFLIWDSMLPHGNGENTAEEPRLAQYLNFYPARWRNVEDREQRVETYRTGAAPEGEAYPGDPRGLELDREPADLTPLGRKLLGLDPWAGWLD